ncbi:MAG: N-acetyltransferase [Chloroflexi bacterium HGW-Chloroflexi-10]|nr:MAG: N-acetyltransferase [Chloroflexi bacterium HGW-Chloroflexi-10]
MKFELPCKTSQEILQIDAREVEAMLQGPALNIPKFPEAMLTLKDGRTLYIREAKMEEVPAMLGYMEKLMKVEHDFYDIVGSRVYSEILGWKRKRLKDPYTLVGLIDGVWSGFANGRLMSEDINISLHTMALVRGGRIGAAMYYAKAYYGFEIIGNKEWWATYESYNGWMRWGLGMAQPSYPWPDVQHELGGAKVYYVTKKYWDSTVKNYVRQMVGADLNFNVTDEVRKANENFIVPEEVLV